MLPGVIPRDRAVSSMHQAASDRLCRPSRASCAVCRSSKASVRRPGASPARQPVSFAGVCECTSRRCLQVRHPSSGECCVRARSAVPDRRRRPSAVRAWTPSRRAYALLWFRRIQVVSAVTEPAQCAGQYSMMVRSGALQGQAPFLWRWRPQWQQGVSKGSQPPGERRKQGRILTDDSEGAAVDARGVDLLCGLARSRPGSAVVALSRHC